MPEPAVGRDAAAAQFETTIVAFSNLAFVPHGELALSGDKTIAYWPWLMTGKNDGPIDPPGFPATGREIEVPGVNVWSFRDGLLLENRTIYDRAQMAIQLGLMPVPRSRAERVYVTLAQLRSRMPES